MKRGTPCVEKHRFEREDDAEQSAALINGGNRSRTGLVTMRVYVCHLCDGFHLTSQRPRKRGRR